MANRSGSTRVDRPPRLTLAALGLALGLVLAACGDARVRLQEDLDTFPLPDHVELVESRSQGADICFAFSCPNVVRYHLSERSVEETCESLQEAVEQWGVIDPRWRNDAEANRCSVSATRKGNEFTLTVFDASRLYPDVAAKLEPGELETYQSAVDIGLLKPDSFLDGLRRLSLLLPPLVLLPLILGLMVAIALTVRWLRKRRRARRAHPGRSRRPTV